MRIEYIEKYRKIVAELVEESYPLLRNKKIRIKEYGVLNFPWYYITTGYGMNFAGYRVVGLNKKTRKYNDMVIKGLLAHELCHIETVEKYLTKSIFLNVIGLIYVGGIYLISAMLHPSFSKKIETETDIEAINKGYGKELYAVAQMRETEFPKWKLSRLYKRGYLNLDEINHFMEQADKNKSASKKV